MRIKSSNLSLPIIRTDETHRLNESNIYDIIYDIESSYYDLLVSNTIFVSIFLANDARLD